MSEKNETVVKNKQYELVPPDGGWGYMICIAAMIVYSTTSMFLGCFGMIYKDFLIELGMGSTSVTVMNGLTIMILSIAGYFTSALVKLIGLQKLALLAALTFSLGTFCIAFVNSTIPFFICLGPLQGTAFGILFNLATSQLNDYFLKKRFMSISFVQTVSALSAMVAPQIVKWSMEYYGYRGTLIVIAAISMQSLIAAVLMEPVEKHMVRVEKIDAPVDETKLLLIEETKTNEKLTTPIVALSDPASAFEAKICDTPETGKNNLKKILANAFDFPLWKKYLKSSVTMGVTFCFFTEGLFILWIPQALYAMGWSENDVAQGVSFANLGDVATRILFAFSSKWLVKLGNHEIYIAGLLVATFSILGMLWSNRIIIVLIFLTITGTAKCTICVLPPMLLADLFKPQEFSSAVGIYMLFIGLFNLILGPGFGAVRDLTDSYPTVFYMIASSFAIVAIMCTIELCYKRNKHKRLLRKEQVEMLQRFKNKNSSKGSRNGK